MVDIRDLKSREELNPRVGSSPTPGTGMDFIYGPIIKAPPGFYPPEAWPEYGHITDPAPICPREQIPSHPAAIRWCLWPLCLEEYTGDTEPDVAAAATGELCYNRIARWQRISDSKIPKGWRAFTTKTPRVDGTKLLESGRESEGWNKNARRDLVLWQKHLNVTHHIEEITPEEYADAYAKSLIAKREGMQRLYDLTRKLALPIAKEHTVLFGVRELSSGNIIAGTAVIFSPSFKSSAHFAPFISQEAREVYAATGLIHHWFLESVRRGMPRAVTTNFWYAGHPKSWRGFSEFKSHFGFEYVAYPPNLYRFVRGKFL